MSDSETLSPSVTDLHRIYQKLNNTPETTHNEDSMMSELSPDVREYLKSTQTGKWPPNPVIGTALGAREITHLKTYLAWTIEHGHLWRAVAAILLLETSQDDVIEASLFDDVMQHIEEKGSADVIPPQLLVTWAKHLQVKGDLHGAIRRLNAARTLISDDKSCFPCGCEAERIRGECTQLAGLTLNKMCCWKNAVQPLMESVGIFRACAAESRNLEAIVVSLEMAAKCLCNLPHGDFLELKEELGFQHGDRFYQAYTMCKDAASLASSSQLLLIRAQNQAAESLLKYAAQHEEDARRYQILQQVVADARDSLQAHTSLSHLQRREQFFEFVHSLFLISLALDFSDCPKDRGFADSLGEQARFLYAEYCRQLSERDFQPGSIQLKECPQAEGIVHSVAEVFNLSLDPLRTGEREGSETGRGTEGPGEKVGRNGGYDVANGHDAGLLDKKMQSLNINGDGSHSQRTTETDGTQVTPQPNSSKTRSMKTEDASGDAQGLPAEIQQNGNDDKALQRHDNIPDRPWKKSGEVDREQRSPLNVQPKTTGTRSPMEKAARNGGDEQLLLPPPSPPRRQQEVGLPVDPQDFSIPVYDVPLSIFQDLIGCKFSGVTTAHDNHSDHPSTDGPVVETQDAPEEDRDRRDGSSLRGITVDSGYGSSVALVDTCLTTKLLTHSESEAGSLGSSGGDSGVGSSSSASTGESRHGLSSSEGSGSGLSKPPGLSLPLVGSKVHDTVRKARLLKFNPVTGIWSSQMTLVYVGQGLQLDPKVKGNCRDALHVQFLHQDEVLGRYVGKRYRRQRPPSQYLQDVTCQKTARFLVTLFNYALKDLRYDIQVVYVPVAHVQLLSRDGEEVEDWLNVEPYLDGDFIKLTNNLHFCNSQGRTLATALTHFTHSVSDGKLMLVDLQGWLPREGRGVVYLTDPQFHTSTPTSLSSCDMGAKGMRAFWESVHPQCNAICRALGLKRPGDLQDA